MEEDAFNTALLNNNYHIKYSYPIKEVCKGSRVWLQSLSEVVFPILSFDRVGVFSWFSWSIWHCGVWNRSIDDEIFWNIIDMIVNNLNSKKKKHNIFHILEVVFCLGILVTIWGHHAWNQV